MRRQEALFALEQDTIMGNDKIAVEKMPTSLLVSQDTEGELSFASFEAAVQRDKSEEGTMTE
jgi:hypothetical protein